MDNYLYEIVVQRGPRQGELFPLMRNMITIGRDPMSDIVLSDPEVSRHQARLRRQEDGSYMLEDLGSTNGTFVDQQRISGETIPIQPGQTIMFGDAVELLYMRSLTGDSDGMDTMLAADDGLTMMAPGLAAAASMAQDKIEEGASLGEPIADVVEDMGNVTEDVSTVFEETAMPLPDVAKDTATVLEGVAMPLADVVEDTATVLEDAVMPLPDVAVDTATVLEGVVMPVADGVQDVATVFEEAPLSMAEIVPEVDVAEWSESVVLESTDIAEAAVSKMPDSVPGDAPEIDVAEWGESVAAGEMAVAEAIPDMPEPMAKVAQDDFFSPVSHDGTADELVPEFVPEVVTSSGSLFDMAGEGDQRPLMPSSPAGFAKTPAPDKSNKDKTLFIVLGIALALVACCCLAIIVVAAVIIMAPV